MDRRFLTIGCLLLSCVGAYGQSFDGRVEEGFAMLRAGQAKAALDTFLELQVESPDADFIRYGIAGAKYLEALELMDSEDPTSGFDVMEESKSGFEGLAIEPDSSLADSARLAAANAKAQIARHSMPLENFEETIVAHEASIRAYRDVLSFDPYNVQAKENLNHMSYSLKTLLQNRPPEQQQQKDGDDGEDGNQSDEGDGGDQGDQNEEGEDSSDQSDEGQDPQDEGDPDERDGEVGEGQQTEADMDQNPLSRQNIEAILKSLEELSKEEQRNMRRSKAAPQIRGGEWW